MSGLINVIKSLLGGIFGFIGGLFGGKKTIEGSAPKAKKGNGYFLELDEAKIDPVAATTTSEVSATEQPMTVSQAAIAAPATPGAAPAKTSTRKEKLAALAAANTSAPTTEAAPAAPAPAAATPAPVAAAPIAEVNFATKYLIPANNGTRRRPGANMSSYLDMARKMNPAG